MSHRTLGNSVVVTLLLVAPLLGQPKPKDSRPALEQVKVLVREVLKLQVEDDSLTFDVKSIDKKMEDDEIKAVQELMGNAARRGIRLNDRNNFRGAVLTKGIGSIGGMRGASWGGGGNSWNVRIDSTLVNTRANRKGDSFIFSIQEVEKPNRRIEVEWNDNGRMTVLVTANEELIYIVQKPDGYIRILHDDKDQVKVNKADSFAELLKKEGDYIKKTLYPKLTGLGFTVPLTRQSKDTAFAVMSLLEGPPSGALSGDAKKRLKDLDSEDSDVREAAVDELIARYHHYEKTITLYRKNPNLSDQAKSQLQRILYSRRSSIRARDFAKEQKLDSDVPFLVSLFERIGAQQHKVIADRLKELTGKDHGLDVKAWKAHADTLSKTM